MNISPSLTPARSSLQAQFFAVQDSAYADFHSGLLPNVPRDRIIGVRMPQLRAIAKSLAAGKLSAVGQSGEVQPLHWQDYFSEVKEAWLRQKTQSLYYEEILTAGLALSYAKLPLSQRFDWIVRFVPLIDNWAVCDTFCGTWKPKETELPLLWDFLTNRYLSELHGFADENGCQRGAAEYDLRYGVVMLLTHFVARQDYIDRVLAICNEIDHPGYYVKMAVAWTLSYGFIFFPEKTTALFQSPSNGLDDFTYNKSIQKACESFRIPKKTKDFLRSLRR